MTLYETSGRWGGDLFWQNCSYDIFNHNNNSNNIQLQTNINGTRAINKVFVILIK